MIFGSKFYPEQARRVFWRARRRISYERFFAVLRMTVVFLPFLSASAFALSIPDKPEGYVNDYAGLLSDSAKTQLSQTLSQFEQETSNQVVVAVFQSLEGGSLEDFSIRLAEKWKVGQKNRDNGVILLIFKEDRAVRIEVGYGLEGALPDAVAGQIVYNEIVPQFREGDFDAGVTNGVNAIIRATKGEYQALPKQDPWQKYNPWIYFALVFYLILFIFRMIFAQALSSGRTYSGSSGGFWGGGSSGGGGFGGGGFSGGGGSFGGGGASGRW